jgi:hypothetical protein
MKGSDTDFSDEFNSRESAWLDVTSLQHQLADSDTQRAAQ